MAKINLETIALKFTKWLGSPISVIVHTILFIGAFMLGFLGVDWDEILLVLTTVVSLEAIYLAIFIQMSVNRSVESLQEVGQDVEEIQKDVDEIQKDVDEIQEDVDEIQKDVDEIQEDVAEEEKVSEIESLKELKEQLKRIIGEMEKREIKK